MRFPYRLPLASLGINPEQMYWNEARLVFALSDARGLQEEVAIRLNESSPLALEPTTDETGGVPGNALSVPIAISFSRHKSGTDVLE